MAASKAISWRCQIPEFIPQCVQELILRNPLLSCPRDEEWERRRINIDKMELKLLTTVGSPQQFRKWLPMAVVKNGFYDVAGQYGVGLKDQKTEQKPGTNIEPLSAIPPPADWRERPWRFGEIRNNPNMPHLLILEELSQPLISLYAKMNELDPVHPLEIDMAMEELQVIFGMAKDDDPLAHPRPHQKSGWRQIKKKSLRLQFPCWNSIDNIQNYAHIYVYFTDRVGRINHIVLLACRDNHQLVVPVTQWIKDGNVKIEWMFIPPEPLFPLWNLPSLTQQPNLPVVISDSIALMYLMPKTDLPEELKKQIDPYLLTTWFGGMAAIDKVDWSPLKNRQVYYLLLNHSGMSEDQAKEMAVKVQEQVLKNALGVKFSIINCLYESGSNSPPVFKELGRIIDPNELLKGRDKPVPAEDIVVLKKNGPPKEARVKRLSEVEVTDDEKKYLFRPIICRNSVSLIYAPIDTGKRTLALSLSCFLACGAKALNKWIPDAPGRVLYVNGSLDEETLGKRLRAITSGFSEEQRKLIDDNIFLVSVEPGTVDLGTKSGQRQMEKFLDDVQKEIGDQDRVSLVIFDRLVSLMDVGDNGWWEFLAWLKGLKRTGIASLIIHDTSKADGMRELETRLPAIDNVIQIKRQGDPDGTTLALSIQVKRGQDLSGAAKRPFSVEFTPTAKSPQWRMSHAKEDVTDVDRSQLRERVQELVDRGASNQEIADELGMEVNTFKMLKPSLVKMRPYKKKNAVYWIEPAAKKRRGKDAKPEAKTEAKPSDLATEEPQAGTPDSGD
jgi:hypothetical protein